MSQAQWAGLVIMILSVIGMLIVNWRSNRHKRGNRRKSGFMGKKTWF